MGIFRVWAGRKTNGFVAGSKFNVEPGDKGMNKVIALNAEAERSSEGKIGWCDSVEIESQDRAWICYKSFDFDCIDKWFCERILLHWREIEAVDVVPD